MVAVEQFECEFVSSLPQTCELLGRGGLIVDPRVSRIILHGSRGPQGGCTSHSDINISLVVDDSGIEKGYEHETLMQAILDETLENWHGDVRLNADVIFDVRGCHMPCLSNPSVNVKRCPRKGIDCFGIYRHGKGYVQNVGYQVCKMRPCMCIWKRSTAQAGATAAAAT